MGKKTYSWNAAKLEDLFDESGDYSGLCLNAPKYSPMRRKEKFRTQDFKTEKKHKDRKRDLRNKIKYDFEL
ncbi:MAG: hypothetical protein OET63_07995 [Desulfobacterales bacterium]|nr:hypothetical protein [Desulfobacterales bacterium]